MSQYFHPPEQLSAIGRKLTAGNYFQLIAQLQNGEWLFGLYDRGDSFVAPRLHPADFNHYENQYKRGRAKSRTFWAVVGDRLTLNKDFYRQT